MREKIKFVVLLLILLLMSTLMPFVYGKEDDGIKDLTNDATISDLNVYRGYQISHKYIVKNGMLIESQERIQVMYTFLVDFDWAIDDKAMKNAKAGSYFEYQLMDPNYVTLLDNDSGDVLNPEDKEYPIGRYSINNEGILRITLNEKGVSSSIHNGTFNASFRVKKKTPSYRIYKDTLKSDAEYVELEFIPREENTGANSLLGKKKGWRTYPFRQSARTLYRNKEKIIEWETDVNFDQLEKLFTKEKLNVRKDFLIESKIPHKLALNKESISLYFYFPIPMIDQNNELVRPHVSSRNSIMVRAFDKGDINVIEPNENESYDEFKERIKTFNTPTVGIYDNPDVKHSSAILFQWGDSPGADKLHSTNKIVFDGILGRSYDLIRQKVEQYLRLRRITLEQADLIYQIYGDANGIDGQVVSFNFRYETKPKTTARYHNEVTVSFDSEERSVNSLDVVTQKENGLYHHVIKSISRDVAFDAPGAFGIVEPLNIPVKKIWSDGNEKHQKENAIVQLYLNGKYDSKYIVLNAKNNWQGVFNDLYRYQNDDIGKYTIRELRNFENYISNIVGNQEDGYIIYGDKTETLTYPIRYHYVSNEHSVWIDKVHTKEHVKYKEIDADGHERNFVYIWDKPSEVPENKVFKCWNTKEDGSGMSYQPGDKAYINEENANNSSDLYAVWENYNFSISAFSNYSVYINADEHPDDIVTFKGLNDGHLHQDRNWKEINRYYYKDGFDDDTLIAIKGITIDYAFVAGLACKYKKNNGDWVGTGENDWYYLASNTPPRDEEGNMYYSKYYSSDKWKKVTIIDMVNPMYFNYIQSLYQWNDTWNQTPYKYVWSDKYFLDKNDPSSKGASTVIYFRNKKPLAGIEPAAVIISPNKINNKIYGDRMEITFKYEFTKDVDLEHLNIKFLLRDIEKNNQKIAGFFYPNIKSIILKDGTTHNKKRFEVSYKVLKGIFSGIVFKENNMDNGYTVLVSSRENLNVRKGDYIEVVLVTDFRFNVKNRDEDYSIYYSNGRRYSEMELPYEFLEKLEELKNRMNVMDLEKDFVINTKINYFEASVPKSIGKTTKIIFANKNKYLGE